MVYVEEIDVGDGESPNDCHGNKFPEVGDSTSMPSEEADAAVFGELFPESVNSGRLMRSGTA